MVSAPRRFVADSARVHILALMGRLSLPPLHSPKTTAAVWIYLASLRLIRRGIGSTSEIVIYSITQNAGPKPGLYRGVFIRRKPIPCPAGFEGAG